MTDRLTAVDTAFLDLEDDEAPMQLTGLLVCEGPAPAFKEVREAFARRLPLLPRFRQRLAFVPFGLHRPEWVDDEAFALDAHLGRATIGPDAGEAEIAAHVDAASAVPLDKARPLWRAELVEGLPDGGFAIGLTLHHCMVDGLSIMHVLGTLLSPDAEQDEPARWTPRPVPGGLRRFAGGGLAHARTPLDALRRVRPRTVTELPARAGRAAAFPAALLRAPRGRLNPRGPSARRATRWIELDLDDVKRARRALDVTVNTVVLAGVAGGLRSYLHRHGERPDRVHAFVPVNVREDSEEGGLGNRITMTYPGLPTGVADPLERVAAVQAETGRLARRGQGGASTDLAAFSGLVPPPLAARLRRAVYLDGGLFNVTVTNVPGPPMTVHFLGRPLRRIRAATPLTVQHALTLAFLSYAGKVVVSVTADPARLPDVDAVVEDLEAAFAELVAAADDLHPTDQPTPEPR